MDRRVRHRSIEVASGGRPDVRVRDHRVGHLVEQLVIRDDEGAKCPRSRRERIEGSRRESIRPVRADEVREMGGERGHDGRVDRVVDPRPDLDVGRVEAFLPGGRHRDDDVAADQLGPVVVMADRRAEQPRSVAPLTEKPVCTLEDRDA